MPIAVGEKVPDNKFPYVPYTPELDDLSVCGTVVQYDIATKWAGKKVVVFAVPGAFTPTCHANHLPGYLESYDKLKAIGVDVVAVVASNDPFVLSGWARVEGLKDKIVALSDTNVAWSKSLGLDLDLSAKGLGVRTNRYVLILDNLHVKNIEVEPNASSVTVTGAKHVLSLL
ncbi:Redoxin [Tylopilus felleus]